MRTSVLKIIDTYLGRLVSCFFRPRPLCPIVKPATLLIIRPGGIGDAVLLLPVIEVLSTHFPGLAVEILAEQRNAAVFALSPRNLKVHCYDRPFELLTVLRRRYDVVIDSEQWYRLSAIVARMTGASHIIGFAGNHREKLLTHHLAYDLHTYEADMFMSLLEPLGIYRQPAESIDLTLPQSVPSRLEELLAPLGGNSFVVLFPGASVPEKVWPVARFQAVATYVAKLGYRPVVLGGKSEYLSGQQIVSGCGGLNLAGSTSLGESAAIIKHAVGCISGDSGLLHIATMLGTPLVALFGPSNWEKWFRPGKGRVLVRANMPCMPCSRYGTIPTCSVRNHCMDEISIDDVQQAVDQMFSSLHEVS